MNFLSARQRAFLEGNNHATLRPSEPRPYLPASAPRPPPAATFGSRLFVSPPYLSTPHLIALLLSLVVLSLLYLQLRPPRPLKPFPDARDPLTPLSTRPLVRHDHPPSPIPIPNSHPISLSRSSSPSSHSDPASSSGLSRLVSRLFHPTHSPRALTVATPTSREPPSPSPLTPRRLARGDAWLQDHLTLARGTLHSQTSPLTSNLATPGDPGKGKGDLPGAIGPLLDVDEASIREASTKKTLEVVLRDCRAWQPVGRVRALRQRNTPRKRGPGEPNPHPRKHTPATSAPPRRGALGLEGADEGHHVMEGKPPTGRRDHVKGGHHTSHGSGRTGTGTGMTSPRGSSRPEKDLEGDRDVGMMTPAGQMGSTSGARSWSLSFGRGMGGTPSSAGASSVKLNRWMTPLAAGRTSTARDEDASLAAGSDDNHRASRTRTPFEVTPVSLGSWHGATPSAPTGRRSAGASVSLSVSSVPSTLACSETETETADRGRDAPRRRHGLGPSSRMASRLSGGAAALAPSSGLEARCGPDLYHADEDPDDRDEDLEPEWVDTYYVLERVATVRGGQGRLTEVGRDEAVKIARDNLRMILADRETATRVLHARALVANTHAVRDGADAARDLGAEVAETTAWRATSALHRRAGQVRAAALDALMTGLVVFTVCLMWRAGWIDRLVADPWGPWRTCWADADADASGTGTGTGTRGGGPLGWARGGSGSVTAASPFGLTSSWWWGSFTSWTQLWRAARGLYWTARCVQGTATGMLTSLGLGVIGLGLAVKAVGWVGKGGTRAPLLTLSVLTGVGALLLPLLLHVTRQTLRVTRLEAEILPRSIFTISSFATSSSGNTFSSASARTAALTWGRLCWLLWMGTAGVPVLWAERIAAAQITSTRRRAKMRATSRTTPKRAVADSDKVADVNMGVDTDTNADVDVDVDAAIYIDLYRQENGGRGPWASTSTRRACAQVVASSEGRWVVYLLVALVWPYVCATIPLRAARSPLPILDTVLSFPF